MAESDIDLQNLKQAALSYLDQAESLFLKAAEENNIESWCEAKNCQNWACVCISRFFELRKARYGK